MTIAINFARDGNADCFALSGWSDQEDEFIWTVGPRSAISLPCLNSEAELEVEAEVTGFDVSSPLPLRLRIGDQVIADFQVAGRQTIKFRIPSRKAGPPDAPLELEHPVFREATGQEADSRPLAFCFRRMSFEYVGSRPRGASSRPNSRILVVGNSHISALRRAYDTRGAELGTIGIGVDFVALPPGHFWAKPALSNHRYDPRVVEEIGQFGAERGVTAVFSTLYGNGHFIVGAIRHSRRFDFVIPGDRQNNLPDDREIVPYALIRKKALEGTTLLLGLLAVLGRRIGVPTYHVASPPPGSDNKRLSDYVRHAAVTSGDNFLDSAAAETPSFRHKVWRVYEDAAREVVESEGGTYLPPPKEALDDAGFLTGSMEHDGFHANAGYGHALLAQLGTVVHGAMR